jgi:hypothetical protein
MGVTGLCEKENSSSAGESIHYRIAKEGLLWLETAVAGYLFVSLGEFDRAAAIMASHEKSDAQASCQM